MTLSYRACNGGRVAAARVGLQEGDEVTVGGGGGTCLEHGDVKHKPEPSELTS